MQDKEQGETDTQALTGAQSQGEHAEVKKNDERVLRQQHILQPKPGEHGRDEGDRNKEGEHDDDPARRPTGEDKRAAEVVERSPAPDRRDQAKVDRLAAPDWRSDQPLPSADRAVDPRGLNTPAEDFEKSGGRE